MLIRLSVLIITIIAGLEIWLISISLIGTRPVVGVVIIILTTFVMWWVSRQTFVYFKNRKGLLALGKDDRDEKEQ